MPPLKTLINIIHFLLTLLGLVVPVLAVKVPVVVGDVLVVVVLPARLTVVEPITNLVVLVEGLVVVGNDDVEVWVVVCSGDVVVSIDVVTLVVVRVVVFK